MRPIRNDRGLMVDTCYLCERKKKSEDDATVIDKLRNGIAKAKKNNRLIPWRRLRAGA
jgi:hypothetical protein